MDWRDTGTGREGEPWSESISHVEFAGFYLTHSIWHNSYGSYQPETGVRSKVAFYDDFRLIQHGSNDWPMVTVVTLAALSKGWDTERIADVVGWLHSRNRKRRTKAKFAAMHDDLIHSLTTC